MPLSEETTEPSPPVEPDTRRCRRTWRNGHAERTVLRLRRVDDGLIGVGGEDVDGNGEQGMAGISPGWYPDTVRLNEAVAGEWPPGSLGPAAGMHQWPGS